MPWLWIACRTDELPASVEVTPVPVAEGTKQAGLAVRAAFELTAADDRWGGWSGASLTGDLLSAVSDQGAWLRLKLIQDPSGVLLNVEPIARGNLHDEQGDALTRKTDADAEGLAYDGDGWVVSFERDHRLLRYPTLDGRPTRLSLPDAFNAPSNGGIEAITRVGDGWLLIAEGADGAGGPHPAWFGRPGAWQARTVPRTEDYRPVELTPIPSGTDIFLVERSYSKGAGLRIRISRIASEDVRQGTTGRGLGFAEGLPLVPREIGVLTPPDVPLDNYEAAATDGRWLYLLSDDNFSADQHTYLLQIEVLP